MNRKIQSLISIMMFAGLLAGGCTKAATPVPTATPTNTPSPAPTIQPSDSTRTLKVGELTREYILHIPPGLDNLLPVPVVFAFHGSDTDAVYMQMTTGFNDIADKNGFLVVYPNGYGRSWNVGDYGPAFKNNVDDIAFVRQMLSDLGTIASINPKRIYAAGFSMGAIFSYRLACEMPDTFAAIAPVEGWLLTDPCQPQQPVSVVHVHGLDDAYAGQIVSASDADAYTDIVFPPVEYAIATWVQLDGCNSTAQVEKQGIVTHTVYSSCRAGTAVELYAIEGWGHIWPSPYGFPTFSTPMIWGFFAAHPKP
jgi:polyhydroxybutyrate depolymerase